MVSYLINDNSSQGVNVVIGKGQYSDNWYKLLVYMMLRINKCYNRQFLITGSNGNVGISNQDPQEKLDVWLDIKQVET